VTILVVLASVCLLASGGFGVLWHLRRQRMPLDQRLARLAAYQQASPYDEQPLLRRFLAPIWEDLTGTFTNLMPERLMERTRRLLWSAGSSLSVQALYSLALVLGTALPVAAFVLLWIATQGSIPVLGYLAVVALIFFGGAGPFVWISSRSQARQHAIWLSLPDAYDLLTISVEAGLGLDQAFQRVTEKLKGPFSQEIIQMLREVALGKERRDALADLARRCDVAEVHTFSNAVLQAEQLGSSLGQVLRVQSQQLRILRRQKAEELAQKAPVKMVFPLVLCILPSVFIVILGPVIINLLRTL